MLRWTIRILLIFAVLVLVAAGVGHLILKSDWLDERILMRVSERIGMDVAAKAISVEWDGETTVREVTVRMPLSDEIILTADRIRLEHEIVPLLILRRRVNMRSVQVESPAVYLHPNENGRWNVQDAWTQWRARVASRERRKRRTSLPQVAIRDALVQIAEPNGASQSLGPLDFLARPEGLAWRFDLDIPAAAEAKGRVLPGGDWAHNVGFAVAEVEPLVRRILGGGLSPIRATGRWEGTVVQGTLSGTIVLDELAIGPVAARGSASVQARAGRIAIRPEGLTFNEPNLVGHEVQLTGGAIRIEEGQIHIEQLAAASSVLVARADGDWDLATRAGEVAGSWVIASAGQSSQYQGTYRASMKSPRLGPKAARVSVTAEVENSFGELTVSASAEGSGADWRQSRWRLSVPALVWSRNDKQVDMAGAAAEIHLAWPEIRLTSLHLPNAKTEAVAQFDADTRRWSARLAAENLGQLQPWGFESLDFQVSAEGDDRSATVSELRVAKDARVVTAKGELSFQERGFQNVRLTADWPAGSQPGSPGLDRMQAGEPAGFWHLEGDVFGRMEPFTAEIAGQLTGRNIALGKQQVSQVRIPVRADADERWVRMASDPFDLFGGVWRLSGQHDLATELTQVGITADSLSVDAIAAIAGLAVALPQGGALRRTQGQGHAQLQIAVSGFDWERAVATGDWSAEDVNIPPLKAQRVRGKLRIGDGQVRFDETVLEQEGGQVRANVAFRLDNPQVLSVELTADGWPIQFENRPESILADGQASLRLDVIERVARGEAKFSADITWKARTLAHVGVHALMRGKTLEIQAFQAETLGGSVEGQATIPLDRRMESTARLLWQGIQPKLLEPWAPRFERFEGVVSGSLTVEQVDQEARPPERMRFVLDADVENGRFGPAQVGDFRIVGFLGERRLLIDEAFLRLLNGQLKARSRVTAHTGRHYGSVALDFNDLGLDQLVHVVDPNAAEHPGNLAGAATILISPLGRAEGLSPLPFLQGEARVNLTRSDLIGNSVVRTLYDAFNPQSGPQEPTGTGETIIRLEGRSVLVPSFIYFNRGIEIRGAWEIEDIDRGRDSPVRGFAVGSTRVLQGIQLPGVDSLDRLMATFQTGAASVKIGGTLGQVEVKVVPLPEVLGSFRNLLWAQLQQ